MSCKQYKLKNGLILRIREANIADAESIIEYINTVVCESDNLTMGVGEFNVDVADERQLIQSFQDSNNSIFLLGEIDNRLVSVLSFHGGKRPRICHTGEFGITVLKEFWGIGIGRHMIEYMLDWARSSNVVRKINLKARSDNHNAIELYKRIGFVQEGLLTRDMVIDGKFIDTIMMGVFID